MIEIQSLKADFPELKIFCDYNEAQLRHYYEPNGGIFIAESAKVIGRALAGGLQPVAGLVSREAAASKPGQEILNQCEEIPVFTAKETLLSQLTGYHLTQGFLLAMKRPCLPGAKQLIKTSRRILILEGLVNPTNVGAVFRSAAAFGVDSLLLAPGCADPLERRTLRVSMGNVFCIPWTYLRPKGSGLKTEDFQLLKEEGFQTCAMALAADAISINAPSLHQIDRLALLLGNEGHGLSALALDQADHKVIIPMQNDVDSLNVAASAAVALWELCGKE